LSVDGSLSGLQLLNLTSDAPKHQQVLHVGYLPPLNSHQQHLSSSSLGCYCGINDGLGSVRTSSDAFTFKFTCGPCEESQHNVPHDGVVKSSDAARNTVKLVLRIASVTYVHIPHLLQEFSLCVSDFHVYFTRITDSLRNAAADLAMGFVMNKHADILTAMSMYGSSWGLEVGHRGSKPDLSFRQKLDRESLSSESDIAGGSQFTAEANERVADGSVATSSLNFLLDAVLESPIVMLPRSPGSLEVLSLHLGKIIITSNHDDESDHENVQSFSDVILIEIRNVSMYSADLEKLQQPQHATELDHGTVMLYDTSVEMRVQQKRDYLDGIFAELYSNIADDRPVCSAIDHLEVTGTVVTPLHIVLTKHHYEQILNTLDNIMLPDDVVPSQSSSDTKQNEHVVTDEAFPGVSALKCDEILTMQQPPRLPGASASSSKRNKPLVVCGSFTMPSFVVQMRADFADGGNEKDIVALRLDGFEVNAVAEKWIKAFDFQLQVCVLILLVC